MFIGTPHPDYYGGLRNTLRWSGFDLSAFLLFSVGADIYNAMRCYFGTSGARYESSRFLEDASYWRLGEVTLGYTLPSDLAARIGAGRARIYVAGKNLYTDSDYSGYAPDLNSSGSSASAASLGTDFYAYPLARTITFGFQGTW